MASISELLATSELSNSWGWSHSVKPPGCLCLLKTRGRPPLNPRLFDNISGAIVDSTPIPGSSSPRGSPKVQAKVGCWVLRATGSDSEGQLKKSM